MVKKQKRAKVAPGKPSTVVVQRKVEPRTWKSRIKSLPEFPDIGVADWRPILQELARHEIHHSDQLYRECHKFVMNAKARRMKKFSQQLRTFLHRDEPQPATQQANEVDVR